MNLVNKSEFHKTKKLAPLIDFVTQYAPYHGLTSLEVRDSYGPLTSGCAWKVRTDIPEDEDTWLAAPSNIHLKVSHDLKYPLISCHVKEVGDVTINNFEEEVVLVLAHELGHLNSFWTLSPKTKFMASDEHTSEVYAERYAVDILEKYRLTKKWKNGKV